MLGKDNRACKVQLNNVGSIKDTSTNQMYYPQKDSKHVICSCFDAYSGIDKVWNIHDVDPEGKGEVNLEINFDKECFMYYQAFVSYVDSLNQVYQCESVKIKNTIVGCMKMKNIVFLKKYIIR